MTERNEVLSFLDELLSSDDEIRREAETEQIRLALALAMVRARKAAGLSQSEVAKRLGVSQSWVSKLENPDIAHTFGSIIDYLHAIGADLDMVIRAQGKAFPVTTRPARAANGPAFVEDVADTSSEKPWKGRMRSRTSALFVFSLVETGASTEETTHTKTHPHLEQRETVGTRRMSSAATTAGMGGYRVIVN